MIISVMCTPVSGLE